MSQVAIIADDFPGMKPRFIVKEGEEVLRGQRIFEDRKLPGVFHTAPAAGRVIAIHRGERRSLRSVVIELSEGELSGDEPQVEFGHFIEKPPEDYDQDEVRALLLESGAWTHLRTRPFGHSAPADFRPAAIFVNGMDTNPLAGDPERALVGRREDLDAGLCVLARLSDGPTYLCVAPGASFSKGLSAPVRVEEFSGPHPAGTAGFHIHTLFPAHRGRVVATITLQEAVAIGTLFKTGKLGVERIVALCGPAAKSPRLLRTRTGASIAQLTAEELNTEHPVRAIAGSVLSGSAASEEAFAYLGRRDVQISLIEEVRERRFFGWLGLGLNQYSTIPVFISKFLGKKQFALNSDTHGSPRAMVPIGMYERVTPWDILPTHLLRSLLIGDVEMAEKLGALELDEEDVALFSFVCPGKTNYGLILRSNLERMHQEG